MALDLARIQFAVTTSLHFLFVVLTLGLGPIIAITETRFAITGKPVFERATKFWGQIYVVNYALGIVVGLVLEFQFGLDWSGLTHFAGDVFGPSLAMETLVAFFVESTFLGIWIFSWGRLPRLAHALVFWVVLAGAYASVFWVLIANGFLNHPVGFVRKGDRLALTDFGALISNVSATHAMEHVIAVVLLAGGLFVAGVSAWHFRRGTGDTELFRSSMRIGIVFAFIGGFLVAQTGYPQLDMVKETQPVKYAMIWRGDLDAAQAQAVAQFGPGDYRPPSWINASFQTMSMIGEIFEYFFWIPLVFLIRNWFERRRFVQWTLMILIPVPFLAATAGWLTREVGRQPWIVYGQLKTSAAVSPVSAGTVLTSLILFTVVFLALAVVDYVLIARIVRRGPDGVVLGSSFGAVEPGPPSADHPPLRL